MTFIILFPLSLLGYGIYSADFPYKIVCALFSLPFLSVLILVNSFWSDLFLKTTYLKINSESVNISCKILNKRESLLVIPAEELDGLELTDRRIATGDAYGKYSEPIEIQPKLIFRVGEKKYSFSKYSDAIFSKSEFDLIADKISKYLPINTDN